MTDHSSHPTYSIAAVSKLTGISCHALRVWERRYGFPVPSRSASGHRRYDAQQVEVLRWLADQVHQGQSISDLVSTYRAGQGEGVKAPASAVGEPGLLSSTALVDCLMVGDLPGAERMFEQLEERLAEIELLNRVIEPALIDIGERWFRSECEIYQERIASSFLRRKLELIMDRAQRSNTQPKGTILVGTVQGDRHEGGVLILSLLLERADWRTLYLGVDLPVQEFQKAVVAWRPAALALSFVLSRNINKRFQELARIRDIPIFVGGRSILNYQSLARRHGLIPLPGLASEVIGPLLTQCDAWWSRQLDGPPS